MAQLIRGDQRQFEVGDDSCSGTTSITLTAALIPGNRDYAICTGAWCARPTATAAQIDLRIVKAGGAVIDLISGTDGAVTTETSVDTGGRRILVGAGDILRCVTDAGSDWEFAFTMEAL